MNPGRQPDCAAAGWDHVSVSSNVATNTAKRFIVLLVLADHCMPL
jgi:hypothetical protein